jgi:tRNA(Ile2) C34 agmatinyltransferase TiaS
MSSFKTIYQDAKALFDRAISAKEAGEKGVHVAYMRAARILANEGLPVRLFKDDCGILAAKAALALDDWEHARSALRGIYGEEAKSLEKEIRIKHNEASMAEYLARIAEYENKIAAYRNGVRQCTENLAKEQSLFSSRGLVP